MIAELREPLSGEKIARLSAALAIWPFAISVRHPGWPLRRFRVLAPPFGEPRVVKLPELLSK